MHEMDVPFPEIKNSTDPWEILLPPREGKGDSDSVTPRFAMDQGQQQHLPQR